MAETPDYSHMKVVLIDDNEMVLSSVESALQQFGFTIRSFKDPLKGIKWIGDNGVDIVISDIYMPECDGFEVLQQVKAIDANCDVIFITAHSQLDIAIRALRDGATDFFEKPFTTDALSAAIERTGRFRILHRQKELLSDKVTILSKELSDSRALTGRNLILGQSQAMKDIAE
jgi:DNA-binding NtrC family response regulator